MWIIRPRTGLIETASIQTIWVENIVGVSLIDGFLDTYYTSTRDSLGSQEMEEIPEIILRRPIHKVFEALTQSAKVAEYIVRMHQGTDPNPPTQRGYPPTLVRK